MCYWTVVYNTLTPMREDERYLVLPVNTILADDEEVVMVGTDPP